MASGDRYQLVLIQKYGGAAGVTCDNVFSYEQTNGVGDATTLLNTFAVSVMDDILSIQSSAITNVQISCINLDNLSDYDTLPDGSPGSASAGDTLPPYATWTFRYVRATRAVKDGRKAFSGIPETNQINGIALGTYLGTLDNVATALGQTLTEISTGSSWEPRIWRRPGTYKSGVVAAPGLFYPIAGVVYSSISTQNTRKYGRGI